MATPKIDKYLFRQRDQIWETGLKWLVMRGLINQPPAELPLSGELPVNGCSFCKKPLTWFLTNCLNKRKPGQCGLSSCLEKLENRLVGESQP